MKKRWRNAVKETNNRDPKGDKVPLMENVFKELIQLGLMYPPFWFSMLESKKVMLILTGRKH